MILEKIYLQFRKNFNRILCLHTVDNKYLDIDRFESFIQYCQKNKINIISLKEILKKPKGRNIALNFDDGYKDNVTILLPLLKKYNLKATLFIATDHLNKKGTDTSLKKHNMYPVDTCMVADLELWQSEGMDIGFHTNSHMDLFESNNEEIEKDFDKGNAYFDKLNQNSYKYFVYPFGYIPKDREFFEKLLSKYNYDYAFSTEWGDIQNNHKYYLKRVSIGDHDSVKWMLWKTIGILDTYYKIRMGNEKNKI